jgi:hypothetical protein
MSDAQTGGDAADTGDKIATQDPYLVALTEAKEGATTVLTDIVDRHKDDPDAVAMLERIMATINPKRRGLEEAQAQIQTPVLRMVQGTTRNKPDGAVPGNFFTSSGALVQAPFEFVPLYMFEANRMFPADQQAAPVCFAPDARLGHRFGLCDKCIQLPFGKNKGGDFTDCDNGWVAMVLAKHNLKLYQLEFFRTSRKAGNQIIGLADEVDDLWDRWMTLSSKEEKNDKGVFYSFKASGQAEDTPAHFREACVALYDMVRSARATYLEKHWTEVTAKQAEAADIEENIDPDKLTAGTEGDSPNPDVKL